MATRLPALSPTDAQALDRALACADACRVLAAGFRDPDDPATTADEELLDLATLRSAARDMGAEPAPDAWRAARRVVDRDARAAEHHAVFGHVVAHGCPPYETEYGRRHVFGQSQELGDIRGFYEAFGVRPRIGGERPDHVACELEFLGLLSLKEASAIATGETERAGVSRSAATRFVADHLGRWLPALAGRLAAGATGSGYAGLAAIAAAVVGARAAELGCAPETLGPDDLLPVETDGEGFTFECGVDAEGGDWAPPGA
jgi:TorA maturation chaperone TorD